MGDGRARLLALLAEFQSERVHNSVKLCESFVQRLDEAETEGLVLANVIKCLGLLACSPFVDARVVVDAFQKRITSADNCEVSQLLCALLPIKTVRSLCFPLPLRCVKSKKVSVKVAALRLLSATNANDFSLLLQAYGHPDARVRVAAVRSLVVAAHKSKLPAEVYGLACYASTNDTSPDVRMLVVALFWLLACSEGDRLINAGEALVSGDAVTLAGDVFARVCNLVVSDSSPSVRAMACSYMPSFPAITDAQLMQTLNKSLITAKTPKNTEAARGEFAVDNEGRLLDSGAAGALIHAIEDEFMAVRAAGIETMVSLCCRSPSFCLQAIDFLVDMSNDDIDSLRIASLKGLCVLGNTVALRENQLQVLLSMLDDTSVYIRSAIHEVLASVRVSNSRSLLAVVYAITTNVHRFPSDRLSALTCVAAIGRTHSSLTELILEEIIRAVGSTDVQTTMPNPRTVSWNLYEIAMAIALNACANNPLLTAVMPSSAKAHNALLHHGSPAIFPLVFPITPTVSTVLSIGSKRQQTAPGGSLTHVDVCVRACSRLLSELRPVFGDGERMRVLVLEATRCVDRYMGGTNRTEAIAQIEFLRLCLRALSLLIELLFSLKKSSQCVSLEIASAMYLRLLRLTYDIQTTFQGISTSLRLFLMLLRLQAHCVLLFPLSQTPSTNTEAISPLLKRISLVKTYAQQHDLWEQLPIFLQNSSESVPFDKFADHVPSVNPAWIPHLKLSSAIIRSPCSTSDQSFVYTPPFPLQIDVEADVNNIDGCGDILLLVQFSNMSNKYYSIPSSNIKRTTRGCFRLCVALTLFPPTCAGSSTLSLQLLREASPDTSLDLPCFSFQSDSTSGFPFLPGSSAQGFPFLPGSPQGFPFLPSGNHTSPSGAHASDSLANASTTTTTTTTSSSSSSTPTTTTTAATTTGNHSSGSAGGACVPPGGGDNCGAAAATLTSHGPLSQGSGAPIGGALPPSAGATTTTMSGGGECLLPLCVPTVVSLKVKAMVATQRAHSM